MKSSLSLNETQPTNLEITADKKPEDVISMINLYWYLERLCDEATDELEDKANSITSRVAASVRASANVSGPIEKESKSLSIEEHWQDFRFKDTDHGSSEFRRRAELARRFHVPHRVLAGSHFVDGATEAELDELESVEQTIRLFQFQMETLELDILEAVPEDAKNALAKLKFVSALLIDGKELDLDYFAYIAKECAEICDSFIDQSNDSQLDQPIAAR